MHGIVFDEVHDEIAVTNPFAQAILFFPADASGEATPLRIIQGPKTHLIRTQHIQHTLTQSTYSLK